MQWGPGGLYAPVHVIPPAITHARIAISAHHDVCVSASHVEEDVPIVCWALQSGSPVYIYGEWKGEKNRRSHISLQLITHTHTLTYTNTISILPNTHSPQS